MLNFHESPLGDFSKNQLIMFRLILSFMIKSLRHRIQSA